MEWLTLALRPTGPYPILILHGPPGSGKTTLARMLRSLIDPVTAPIQPLPSRGRAILESAVRDRVLVFDHVTHMSNSVADALCQISSGTGVSVKEPIDPGRDALRLDLARPIILTTPRLGVHDWQPRPDLAHRSITVEVTAIPTDFDPAPILASLYTALSESLGKPQQPWNRPPDLSLEALTTASNIADPLFPSILALVASAPKWTGTATDLSDALNSAGSRLPTPDSRLLTPRSLSHRLRQLQQTLSIHGISIEFSRLHAGLRTITITNKNLRHPPAPHNPQPTSHNPPPVINDPLNPSPSVTGPEEVLPCNSR
jgi:energy-coupling factor transporter ATP-binding protein EcfA2